MIQDKPEHPDKIVSSPDGVNKDNIIRLTPPCDECHIDNSILEAMQANQRRKMREIMKYHASIRQSLEKRRAPCMCVQGALSIEEHWHKIEESWDKIW